MAKQKKGVGRPKGDLEYSMENWTRILEATPLSTQQVCEKFADTYGASSWNTANKYLRMLRDKGLVKHLKVGGVNLWSR